MLAAEQRLRRADEFSAAIRQGERAGRAGLVVHVFSGPDAPFTAAVRAGFVVPKAVGSAVTRNKVRRRLRHLLRERLAALPPGTDLVVRVLPPAVGESYQQLGAELDEVLAAARRRGARSGRSGTRRAGKDRPTQNRGGERV